MENEKLKLLLNKVVEYNDPKAYGGKGCHFKAFLYKRNSGYYFKVVEVVSGTDLAFNDLIDLKEGDEKYLIIAEKPKLMRVSKNSWHYKLMKYVLKSNAPTPKDMQNGCPYFWLLAFSLLVIPFIMIFKGIVWVLSLVPRMLFWVMERMVIDWINGLEDEIAYDAYQTSYGYSGGGTKMPKIARIFFAYSDESFYNLYLKKKYNLDRNDPEFKDKAKEFKLKWEVWNDKIRKDREVALQESLEREEKERQLKIKRDKRRKEVEAKWEARMKPIKESLVNIGSWFRKTFTVERGRVNMIVKRTKQFFGTIVTLLILGVTFNLVNVIASGVMVVIDWSIVNWMYFVYAGLFILGCGVAYLFYVLITSWGERIVGKYKNGKKVWYVEPFIYLIWLPIKYLVMFITYIVVNVIYIPLKAIFYTLLFLWILKPLAKLVVSLTVSLVKGIGSSTGIFGEYFGASYSDYCPGIEWCDFDEQE